MKYDYILKTVQGEDQQDKDHEPDTTRTQDVL